MAQHYTGEKVFTELHDLPAVMELRTDLTSSSNVSSTSSAPEVNRFSPFGTHADIFIGIYLAVLGTTALLTNVVVIYKTLCKGLREIQEMDKINIILALCQVCPTVYCYPRYVIAAFKHHWPFSLEVCNHDGFVTFFFAMSTIGLLVMTTLYRYLRMFHSNVWQTSLCINHHIFHMCILTAFIYAALCCCPPLLGVGRFAVEPFNLACSLDWVDMPAAFTLILTIFGYIMPCVIMLICYTRIINHVRSSSRHLSRGMNMVPSTTGQGPMCGKDSKVGDDVHERHTLYKGNERSLRGQPLSRDMQVILLLALHYGLFMVVWTPYAIVSFLSTAGLTFPNWLLVLSSLVAKSDTIINPFVYFFIIQRSRNMRRQAPDQDTTLRSKTSKLYTNCRGGKRQMLVTSSQEDSKTCVTAV